jgi:hypothetical protein
MEFDETDFWKLVDLAQKDFDAYTRKLEKMSREELVAFEWKFEETAGYLYKPEFGVNFPSEDAFEDLAAYVVGQGKKYYDNVLNNPSEMPADWDRNKHGLDIQGQAATVYYERYGEEMPPFEG